MQRTGGELVLDSLKAAGVDTAFGIISVHNIPIFDAMGQARQPHLLFYLHVERSN